jgi:apolipoprotein N-acyltransferase
MINESWKHRYKLAAVTGLLLVLATPPLSFGFLAWIALIPLFIALEDVKDGREAIQLGFLTGLIFYSGTVYWIAWNSGTNIFARIGSASGSVLLLASTLSVVTWSYARVLKSFGKKGHYFAPLLWMAFETMWHHTELAFPWPILALTQGEYLPVLQLASVGGTTIVAGWVVTLNAVLTAGRDRRMAGIIFVLLLIIVWSGGTIREKAVYNITSQTSIGKIGLVQGNIDAAKKWELGPEYSINKYEPITVGLKQDKPDLVVWPETASPVYIKQNGQWRRHFNSFVDSLGFTLVTGGRYAEFNEGVRTPYNAAFMIYPGAKGLFEIYAKVHLVPFGERVPFQKYFPILGKLNLGQAEFKPWPGIELWEVKGKNGPFIVSPFICFESIFPDLGVEAANRGMDVILNLTNDGWFDGTSEKEQHLYLSRIRSIETGRSLVRSTNTGISAIVGPSGRILKKLPNNTTGALIADIPEPFDTPFIRWGWKISYFNLIITALLILFTIFKKLILNRKTKNTNA